MDLNDLMSSSVLAKKLCVFSGPKCGKTQLVGELANFGFILDYVDLESGIETLFRPEVVLPEFRKNINYLRIPDHKLYPIAIDTMRSVMRGSRQKICYLHGKTNCPECAKIPGAKYSEIELASYDMKRILVIDTMTQLANSALYKVIKNQLAVQGDEYQVTFHDYRAQGNALDEILSRIQVSNCHVIVLSHDVDVEKDEKKAELLRPYSGTRNFSKTVGKYFGDIIYLYREGGKHRIASSTTFNPNILTGGRSHVTLENMAEPSLLPFFIQYLSESEREQALETQKRLHEIRKAAGTSKHSK